MSQQLKSQRTLLIQRVHKQRLADNLVHNIQKLSKDEERLSSSRISSTSSASLKSIRRAYSTISINRKNPKQEMLRQIIEKLKSSKKLIEKTPKQQQKNEDERMIMSEKKSVKGKVNKLELMMKDIKKCNQMSTKAVYSIKKNIKDQIKNLSKDEVKGNQDVSNRKHIQNSNIFILINQLALVKEQLKKIKDQNQQLVKIIKQKKQQGELNCNNICTCFCHKNGK